MDALDRTGRAVAAHLDRRQGLLARAVSVTLAPAAVAVPDDLWAGLEELAPDPAGWPG